MLLGTEGGKAAAQQLAGVPVGEPLLSSPPASLAFARFFTSRSTSSTNALSPASPKRFVNLTCNKTARHKGQPGEPKARCGAQVLPTRSPAARPGHPGQARRRARGERGSAAPAAGPGVPTCARRSWRRCGAAGHGAAAPGAAASGGWSGRRGWPGGSCTAPSAA